MNNEVRVLRKQSDEALADGACRTEHADLSFATFLLVVHGEGGGEKPAVVSTVERTKESETRFPPQCSFRPSHAL